MVCSVTDIQSGLSAAAIAGIVDKTAEVSFLVVAEVSRAGDAFAVQVKKYRNISGDTLTVTVQDRSKGFCIAGCGSLLQSEIGSQDLGAGA